MDKKKILVIDDDPGLVKVIAARLEASGYGTVTANDGVQGMEKAKNEKPDLILLDIKMPNMDGHTMLRNLKKYGEGTKPIPVIMLTGYDGLDDLFGLEGAVDYIVKPFEDKDLLLRISKALKGAGNV